MKSSVAITLIIAGALLVLAPLVYGYLHESLLARLLMPGGIRSVNLERSIDGSYSWLCLFTGLALIVVAINRSKQPL